MNFHSMAWQMTAICCANGSPDVGGVERKTIPNDEARLEVELTSAIVNGKGLAILSTGTCCTSWRMPH
jgi:hypothetical protein